MEHYDTENAELQCRGMQSQIEIVQQLNKNKSKAKNALNTMDVLATAPMGYGEQFLGVDAMRCLYGVQFNWSTTKTGENSRYERLESFKLGDSDSLISDDKYAGSGWYWPEKAVNLFKKWWSDYNESGAIYVDQLGRKVNWTDYDGVDHYTFLYGVRAHCTVHFTDSNRIRFYIELKPRIWSASNSIMILVLLVRKSGNECRPWRCSSLIDLEM